MARAPATSPSLRGGPTRTPPTVADMAAAQRRIILSDGPRKGEDLIVNAGPAGPPNEVTVLDPPGAPLVVPRDTPHSTTYWRVYVGADDPHSPLTYQSTAQPGS